MPAAYINGGEKLLGECEGKGDFNRGLPYRMF